MATSTTAPDLRPLGIGELLDAAFKIYRTRFKTLVLCVLVPVVPIIIVQQLVLASVTDDLTTTQNGSVRFDFTATAVTAIGVVVLLSILLGLLATAACTRAVTAAYLDQPTTWQESLRFALRKVGPLLLLALVAAAASFAVVFLIAFIAALVHPATVVLTIPAAIYLLVRLLLIIVPVRLVEDVGAVASLRRSWSLVGGRWWASFALVVILVILTFVLTLLLQTLLVTIPVGATGSTVVAGILNTRSWILTNVITTPIGAAVLTLLYFDLRVRKEGLDLELLADRIGEAGPADVARSSGLGGYESTPPPTSPGGFSAPPPEGR